MTKYRRQVFTKLILTDMEKVFSHVCKCFEANLIEFDAEGDHVHLLVTYPPKVAISKFVNSLKGPSSRVLRNKHSEYLKPFLWGKSLWSPSYFAGSCGGASIGLIRQYIQKQQTPI